LFHIVALTLIAAFSVILIFLFTFLEFHNQH